MNHSKRSKDYICVRLNIFYEQMHIFSHIPNSFLFKQQTERRETDSLFSFLLSEVLELMNRALNSQSGSSSQAQDVKQRMNHLKLMNCRKNMLREIRSRRVDQENISGFM